MGRTNYINPYLELYKYCKYLYPGYIIQVIGIVGIIKTQVRGTFFVDLEYDTGKIHNLNFGGVYYLPGPPKLIITPQEWSHDRGESEFGQEETYLKFVGK